jgi:hypothetical protein
MLRPPRCDFQKLNRKVKRRLDMATTLLAYVSGAIRAKLPLKKKKGYLGSLHAYVDDGERGFKRL